MVIAGIRFVLVLGNPNAVMPHIDFEAWEYEPNSRKMELLYFYHSTGFGNLYVGNSQN